MPNIDLKEKFLIGPELRTLSLLLKSRPKAIGSVVEFWEVAAEFWARGELLMPETVFKSLKFSEHLFDENVSLAQRRDGGVFAVGSEEMFGWIKARRSAGRNGGIQSGITRSNKNKDMREANVKQNEPPVPIPIPKEDRIHVDEQEKLAPAPEAPALFPERQLDYDHETVNLPEKDRPLPKLAVLWNQHATKELARVAGCTGTRRKHAANRWKENPSDEFWSDLIWKINRSDFCLGKTPRGTWKATFDWLVRPGTADKIREGQYDNRGPGTGEKKKHPYVLQMEAEEAARKAEEERQ